MDGKPRLDAEPKLPDHVEKSVEAIAEVHRLHERRAGPLQRTVERVTAVLARPTSIVVIVGLAVCWMAGNAVMAGRGGHAPDPPPFAWLELSAALGGFVFAALILATQKREDQIDKQRSQLTLELAMLSEQKTAKLVALLEEIRRDSPALADRVDVESDAMSRPADAQSVLDALERQASDLPED